MMFGGPTDEATSARIIDQAHEQGVNSIDTADVYGKGESERVVGRSIAAQRERWVLATKFANPLDSSDVNARGASRKHIVRAVDASLKRLNTDYIDLLYIHREDHETPVEETVRALNDLIQAGKLRYYGLSNHRAWKIAEFSHTAQALGLDAPVASQPLYNIANRQAEAEQLTAAHRYGLGVISYSPLARGVLTGKYEPGATPASDTRAGAATGACSRPNGVRNRSNWRGGYASMQKRGGFPLGNSRSPGCSIAATSVQRSAARVPRRNGRTICRR
jgi:aryl-alcohol dehydrogenase-like predicted oxidoreductase